MSTKPTTPPAVSTPPAASAAKLSRREPECIGRYEIVQKLGSGGMGTVYLATTRPHGELFAIKTLKTKLSENPKAYYRFAQEFQATQKLDHPNIARSVEIGLNADRAYIVMEYVEGQSLGDILDNGPLSEDQAVRIITQVAQALHYAHRRRILHRDVKPDNILIRADGLAKLTDFGLAKDHSDDKDLTRPETGLGTPHFMAPEQYDNAKNADVRCDVYSLGATLYVALTGRVPFQGTTNLQMLTQKLRGEAPSPRELVPTVSEAVDDAVRRAMSPNPQARPENCLKFVRLLGRKRVNRPMSTVTPPPRSENERRRSARYTCSITTNALVDTNVIESTPDFAESWPGTVDDLSITGLGLTLARRFEIGTELDVELDDKPAELPKSLRVTVTRIKQDTLGHWFHGCKLKTELTKEQILRLL